jgi:hypothetical protein
MKWLCKIPLIPLIVVAIFIGLAPFVPQPHLWEKLNMLFDGTLSRPMDIFDLFWHGTVPVLLFIKIFLQLRNPGCATSGSPSEDQ